MRNRFAWPFHSVRWEGRGKGRGKALGSKIRLLNLWAYLISQHNVVCVGVCEPKCFGNTWPQFAVKEDNKNKKKKKKEEKRDRKERGQDVDWQLLALIDWLRHCLSGSWSAAYLIWPAESPRKSQVVASWIWIKPASSLSPSLSLSVRRSLFCWRCPLKLWLIYYALRQQISLDCCVVVALKWAHLDL